MPSDTAYMQTEKTRGFPPAKKPMMKPAMAKMSNPEGLEEMEPMEKPESGEAALAAAKYTGPEQRCQMCRHFEEPDQCAKYQAAVDPEGHCESFAAQGGEEEEAETPAEDNAAEEMEELK